VTSAPKYDHRTGGPPIVDRTGAWDASSRAPYSALHKPNVKSVVELRLTRTVATTVDTDPSVSSVTPMKIPANSVPVISKV
jgi:hypothetical protein